MSKNIELINQIRSFLASKGKNQADLISILNISDAQISKIFTGKAKLHYHHLTCIIKFLNLSKEDSKSLITKYITSEVEDLIGDDENIIDIFTPTSKHCYLPNQDDCPFRPGGDEPLLPEVIRLWQKLDSTDKCDVLKNMYDIERKKNHDQAPTAINH